MNTKIRIIAVTIALLGGTLPANVVLAGDQGTNCPTDPERVRLYENAIGDTSDGNDTLIICGTAVDDLALIDHTLDGVCKSGGIRLGDNWNDCVSSIYPIIPAGRALCLYGNNKAYRDAHGPNPYVLKDHSDSGFRQNLTSGNGLADGLSSLRFIDPLQQSC